MEIEQSSFDFEVERILEEIDEKGCEKVALQFPEGLKRRATEVVEALRERAPDTQFYISGEPCYGACDLDEWLLRRTDVLVHFGHSPIRDSDSVIYVEMRSRADVEEVVHE
ncbi:MAG: diphthamide synthesis protein, partial [Halobacteria archaeon]|nr:diphthamide synthesis protein [Halobacteria archaeon]